MQCHVVQVAGRKYKYLGLFLTESEAATAYDRAAVHAKGLQALTNYDITNYVDDMSAHLLKPLTLHNPSASRCNTRKLHAGAGTGGMRSLLHFRVQFM